MKHISRYKIFEAAVAAQKQPTVTADVWSDIDNTADRIMTEGYGKPIRDLIASNPLFAVEKYGKQVCDTDVLFDRFHQLKQKNLVLKNVSFAERMTMLLTMWKAIFNEDYNPTKLKFSDWVNVPQTLYRGMSAEKSASVIESGLLSGSDFYSFSFIPTEARKFTSDRYASGHYVPKSALKGYVFSTETKPIDFHIFMGAGLEDEMEVILRAPVKVELYGTVNMPEILGVDLGFKQTA